MPGNETTANRRKPGFLSMSPAAFAALAALGLAAVGTLALTTANAHALAAPAFAGTFLLIAIGLAAAGRLVAACATTVSGGAFVLAIAARISGTPATDNALAATIVVSALVALWALERRSTDQAD